MVCFGVFGFLVAELRADVVVECLTDAVAACSNLNT
jgi:hypothetical protein